MYNASIFVKIVTTGTKTVKKGKRVKKFMI